MRIEQKKLIDNNWIDVLSNNLSNTADLVFIFGATSKLNVKDYIEEIQQSYPNAILIGCSTAGEISDVNVSDDSLIVTAVNFEHTTIKNISVTLDEFQNDYDLGKHVADSFEKKQLTHIFILSDGLNVNGTELVKGLNDNLPEFVSVTGGLSGDGDRFNETVVVTTGQSKNSIVNAIGLYSDRLKVGYGSFGGWDPFGPERLITESDSNVLYELDGKSALGLYKKYLGENAHNLPASGLLFPLSLRSNEENRSIVRTILSVDEEKQCMTFAGDMPRGTYARLMKANIDRLIDGATEAAVKSKEAIDRQEPDLAILISCVGRKMVLKQRTEEEVEAVKDVLGKQTVLTGFYSYGEISPFEQGSTCELHNQTMTVTTFLER